MKHLRPSGGSPPRVSIPLRPSDDTRSSAGSGRDGIQAANEHGKKTGKTKGGNLHQLWRDEEKKEVSGVLNPLFGTDVSHRNRRNLSAPAKHEVT